MSSNVTKKNAEKQREKHLSFGISKHYYKTRTKNNKGVMKLKNCKNNNKKRKDSRFQTQNGVVTLNITTKLITQNETTKLAVRRKHQ